MRFVRACGLPLMFLVLGAGWTPPREESVAERALREKGLIKAGITFTIEDEKPVLAKLKEARTAYNAFAAMSGQHADHQELAARASQLEQQRSELQTQLDQLNQQISSNSAGQNQSGFPGAGMGRMGGMMNRPVVSPLTIERDQLQASLNQVTSEQKTIRNQSPQAKDTKALDDRIKQAEETFKTTIADLRKQVDEVKQKYTDLEGDATVKQSLGEVKKVNPKLHIGPSDAFNAGVKELVKAEQQFLGKRSSAAVSKKKARSKK